MNVRSKRNKNKKLANKNYFLLASWRSLPRRAGSRAGPESDPPQDLFVKETGTDPKIRILT